MAPCLPPPLLLSPYRGSPRTRPSLSGVGRRGERVGGRRPACLPRFPSSLSHLGLRARAADLLFGRGRRRAGRRRLRRRRGHRGGVATRQRRGAHSRLLPPPSRAPPLEPAALDRAPPQPPRPPAAPPPIARHSPQPWRPTRPPRCAWRSRRWSTAWSYSTSEMRREGGEGGRETAPRDADPRPAPPPPRRMVSSCFDKCMEKRCERVGGGRARGGGGAPASAPTLDPIAPLPSAPPPQPQGWRPDRGRVGVHRSVHRQVLAGDRHRGAAPGRVGGDRAVRGKRGPG